MLCDVMVYAQCKQSVCVQTKCTRIRTKAAVNLCDVTQVKYVGSMSDSLCVCVGVFLKLSNIFISCVLSV